MSRDGADVAALEARVAALTHEVERVAWQFKVDPYPQRVRDLEADVARLREQLARHGYVFEIDDRAAVDAALDAPAPDPPPPALPGERLRALMLDAARALEAANFTDESVTYQANKDRRAALAARLRAKAGPTP